MNMKKTAYILILTLILFSGKAAAQCVGDLTANITGGSTLICFNTSPGTFTAVGGGESGSYTYLWYLNDISTGVTTQNYNPGNLTANTTVYCAIMSGICGPVNTPKQSITVVSYPTAPVIGTITQPNCTVSTGSVPLSGLPTPNDWTITISPGGATQSGNGATTTINNLSSGTYTFKVTNYAGLHISFIRKCSDSDAADDTHCSCCWCYYSAYLPCTYRQCGSEWPSTYGNMDINPPSQYNSYRNRVKLYSYWSATRDLFLYCDKSGRMHIIALI